jgi:hypothetical protein
LESGSESDPGPRAVREVRDLLREDRALRGRVDDHERRIAVIEARAGE